MDEKEFKSIFNKLADEVLSDLVNEMHMSILKTMCMMFWTYRNAYMSSLVNTDKD